MEIRFFFTVISNSILFLRSMRESIGFLQSMCGHRKEKEKRPGWLCCPVINIVFVFSVVGGCQSGSLWHPQPAGLLWVWRPQGLATGPAALPLATAKRSLTSFSGGVCLKRGSLPFRWHSTVLFRRKEMSIALTFCLCLPPLCPNICVF